MLPLVVPEVVEPDVLLPLVEPLPDVLPPDVLLPEVVRPEVLLPEVERPEVVPPDDRVEALVVRLTPPELVVPPILPFVVEPDDLPLVELPLVEDPEVDLPLVEPPLPIDPLVLEPLVDPPPVVELPLVEPLVLPPPDVEPPVVPWSVEMTAPELNTPRVLADVAKEVVVRARARMARLFFFIVQKFGKKVVGVQSLE